MLSAPITGEVSSLVRYIANLGKGLLISVCCMRSWINLFCRLNLMKANTNKTTTPHTMVCSPLNMSDTHEEGKTVRADTSLTGSL